MINRICRLRGRRALGSRVIGVALGSASLWLTLAMSFGAWLPPASRAEAGQAPAVKVSTVASFVLARQPDPTLTPIVEPASQVSLDGEADEASETGSTPDQLLRAALEAERRRDWLTAIETYEQALDRWPNRSEFRHRLRLCEIHYRLGRRYKDRSFRDDLLRLSSEEVLAMYDELLERIETSYVEPVRFEPLLRGGYDNLEVALRDPIFLEAHGIADRPGRVRWLRDALRDHRERVRASKRSEARAWVESACGLAKRSLDLSLTAVVLEFIYGACEGLDDYSGCLTPDRLADLYAEIDGQFVGIGVELKDGDRGLLVVGVIEGGPAAHAGVDVGDEILEVDGRSIEGLSLDEGASELQGAEGTALEIVIDGPQDGRRRLSLVRRPVEVHSVETAKLLEGGIGYIRLVSFQKTSIKELDDAIATLSGQGMTQLILDLRGNPGGLLNIAVEIADRFLDGGRIVTTRGRAPGQSFHYEATPSRPWRVPVTVLIDRDSASASEILAGALQDHRRASVIGQRSFGKGSVQSIFPFRSVDAALKLTTAKFYSPTDRAYSEQGVTPDLVVRSSARPNPTARVTDMSPFGDPDRDDVLRAALSRLQASASNGR